MTNDSEYAGWIDTFLIFDCVIVICLSFIDWLIGEKGRKHMREVVGD